MPEPRLSDPARAIRAYLDGRYGLQLAENLWDEFVLRRAYHPDDFGDALVELEAAELLRRRNAIAPIVELVSR